ncbi:MAG: class I SAM-dependent methyltransferase [Polyangiaceae bacterium]
MPLGLFPQPDQASLNDVFSRFSAALRAHSFEETGTLPVPGRLYHLTREPETLSRFFSGGNNAYESSALDRLYRVALAQRLPNAVALFETFHLGRPTSRAELDRLIGEPLVDELLARHMLVETDGRIVSRVRASGMAPLIQLHDTNSIYPEEKGSFVFCGRCSSRLVNAVRGELDRGARKRRVLDLCTGSGIQALNMAPWADEIVGADLNPRAVAFATANAKANGIDKARFVESDLFGSVEGRFDVITANTPFLLLDEGSKARDGYGGAYGMEVELRLIAGLHDHLEDGGVSLLVVSSAFVDGRNLLEERLKDTLPSAGYDVDLFPISQYYSTDHWRAYERVQVAKCVLYIMRAEKRGGGATRITPHDWPLGVRQALDLKVKLERQIARRKAIRRFGTDALG